MRCCWKWAPASKATAPIYPGIDLVHPPDGMPALYTHNDGTPYPDIRRRTPDEP